MDDNIDIELFRMIEWMMDQPERNEKKNSMLMSLNKQSEIECLSRNEREERRT